MRKPPPREPLVHRGIYLADSGYWWGRSPTRAGYVHSMHTKDYFKAKADYDRQFEELKAYEAMEKK